MSRSRAIVVAAELVCTVDSTRCPVSAACTAICAVSPSRISPTMITSGSCRRIERSKVAKVSPICGLTWIWLMPRSWYSIGSSTVTTLRVMAFSPVSPVYSVVVLPLPVGPVTSTMPLGSSNVCFSRSTTPGARPSVP